MTDTDVYLTIDSKDSMMQIDTDIPVSSCPGTPSAVSVSSTPEKPDQVNPFASMFTHWETMYSTGRYQELMTSVLDTVDQHGTEPFVHLLLVAQYRIVVMMADSLYKHTNAGSAPVSLPLANVLYYDHLCGCASMPQMAMICPMQRLLNSTHMLWKTAVLSHYYHQSHTELIELFFKEEIKQPERLEALRQSVFVAYPGFREYLEMKQAREENEDNRNRQSAAAQEQQQQPSLPLLRLTPTRVVRPKPLSRRLPFVAPSPPTVPESNEIPSVPSAAKRRRVQ
jgi:hypothetical protein